MTNTEGRNYSTHTFLSRKLCGRIQIFGLRQFYNIIIFDFSVRTYKYVLN